MSEKIKYKELYRTDPNKNPFYSSGKEFANDQFLNSNRKGK